MVSSKTSFSLVLINHTIQNALTFIPPLSDMPHVNGPLDSQAAKTILLNTEPVTWKQIFGESANSLYQPSRFLL